MKKSLIILLTFFTLIFQSQTKLESQIYQYYDASSNTWQNSQGNNFVYDVNNNLASNTNVLWNTGTWSMVDRLNYVYNANNKVILETAQNWDSSLNQFINDYKTTNTYNANYKITQLLTQNWNGFAWINTRKTDINYNGLLILNALEYSWDGFQWVNNSRYTPSYSGNNLTQYIKEIYSNSIWVNDEKEVYTYNSDNKRLTNLIYYWVASGWELNATINYTIDSSGNRISEMYSENGQNTSTENYQYDFSQQMSSYTNPYNDKTGIDYFFNDAPFVNKILSSERSFYYSPTATTFFNRTNYNYQSQIVLSNDNFELKSVKLFPNPTSSVLNIETDKIVNSTKIVDATGKVAVFSSLSNKTIDVNALSSGVYFVEIKTDEGFFMGKFIKK